MDKEIITRLKGWMRGEKVPPYRIELNPTDLCNLECIFCRWRAIETRNPGLPDGRMIELVHEGAKLGAVHWQIVGAGEPLYRFNLTRQLMLTIKQVGGRGSMITNGTIFPERFVNELVDAGWDEITISLDAPISSVHNKLRRNDKAFELVQATLRRFKNIKRRLGSDKPFLSFHLVLCSDNYRLIGDMLRYSADNGVGYLFIQPLNVYHELGASLALSDLQRKQFQQLIPSFLDTSREVGVGTNLEGFLEQDFIRAADDMNALLEDDLGDIAKGSFVHAPCFEPWIGMVIRTDGGVAPCCVADATKENVMEKSLEEIWYGDVFTRLRKAFISWQLPAYCSQCGMAKYLQNRQLRMGIDNDNSIADKPGNFRYFITKLLTKLSCNKT